MSLHLHRGISTHGAFILANLQSTKLCVKLCIYKYELCGLVEGLESEKGLACLNEKLVYKRGVARPR